MRKDTIFLSQEKITIKICLTDHAFFKPLNKDQLTLEKFRGEFMLFKYYNMLLLVM